MRTFRNIPFLLLISLGAFAILSGAAVWLGGLNQDEGWYLYAANMVAEGQMPYRDFFYTQGPLLPYVYSAFTWVWRAWGLLGARVFTLLLGVAGILFAVGLAARLAPSGRRRTAALIAFLLLGCNLYHLYYVAIPKTYALASLLVLMGFFHLAGLSRQGLGRGASWLLSIGAGLCLAFASGARISLGALLAIVGLWLLLTRQWRILIGFCIGGFGGLALVYLPFLCDAGARAGLIAAQQYHAARGGFDPVWTVGSFSRLVRWYLPVFIVLGMGVLSDRSARAADARQGVVGLLLWGFLAVFVVQMLAPFPYEDYQVPIIGLLAVYAAVNFTKIENTPLLDLDSRLRILLVLGLAFASAFGSPLLEKWMTNGQDRFWTLKKEKCELAQLRDVARRIEAADPGGRELLTQDLYLAIETGRRVPHGLEMGPFAMLTDDEWRALLASAPCPVAALSGYSFAINPPRCDETPIGLQMEYWEILKRNYELADREEHFGQNATTLLILKRK